MKIVWKTTAELFADLSQVCAERKLLLRWSEDHIYDLLDWWGTEVAVARPLTPIDRQKLRSNFTDTTFPRPRELFRDVVSFLYSDKKQVGVPLHERTEDPGVIVVVALPKEEKKEK